MLSGLGIHNKTIPLFVSSDPVLGAINTTAGGDRFQVQFKNTIEFPPEAENISLEVVQSTIWWTVLNITLGVNDLFQLNISGDPGSPYTVTLDPGLYDVSGLNNAVNRELINLGLASGLVIISGDSSTQKILITLTAALLQVEWIPQSFFLLTGFTSGQTVPAVGFTTAEFSELAPNVANFSDISSFLLHTDLVQSGIPLGDQLAQTIAQVQINVPPGSQINFQPQNPIQLNVNHLRGQLINQASFWVTDQINRTLDFNGEFFTLLLVFRYYINEVRVTHI